MYGRDFHVRVTERESGADQCAWQFLLSADANPAAVDLRALAARCGKQFLAQRVVDDAMFHATFFLHTDRHGPNRKAVQIVGGAVQRVDDPDGIGVAAGAAFLSEDGVIGIVFVNTVDNSLFCGAIGVTDEIVVGLLFNLELVEIDHFLDQRAAGTAGGHHGHIEKWVHQTIPLVSKNSAFGRLRR